METSIISYLTARPSRDLVITAHQQTTREWWEKRRKDFEIFVSRLVWQEASAGDTEAVNQRLKILKPLRWLQFRKEVSLLAKALLEIGPLPAKAANDAVHIALAAVHGMHFLLTWNCAHINNAEMVGEIRRICEQRCFPCPVICTPEELRGV
jgi:predicted nucleic acid-binding protein